MSNKVIVLIIVMLNGALTVGIAQTEEKIEKASFEMKKLIAEISNYSNNNSDHGMIIVPQNGTELAFEKLVIESMSLDNKYLNSIDGFGVEDLFYDGKPQINREKLKALRIIKSETDLPILVSDYIEEESDIGDFVVKVSEEGFMYFPRGSSNYYYTKIPEAVSNSNPDNVSTLAKAKNYLYYLDSENTTINGFKKVISKTNYDVLIIDLFQEDNGKTVQLSKEDIKELRKKIDGGRRLILCYLNIGAIENYRCYWKDEWDQRDSRPSWIKKPYVGFPDEYWVEFWNKEWKDILIYNENSYVSKIIEAGFDGIYLDNVEAYYFLYKD